MPVTASGSYATAKDYLREAIARSAAWQTLTGAASTAAARLLVIVGEDDAPPSPPFAVILESDEAELSHRRIAVGAFSTSGTLAVQLYGVVENDTVARDAKVEADSDFGAFVDLLRSAHMSQCADDGTLIVIREVVATQGPKFIPRAQQDDLGIKFQNWYGVVRVALGDE